MRVEKVAGGVLTDYVYDVEGRVMAEANQSGWQAQYARLGGQLVAEYKNSTTYFIFADHLASTRVVTNVSGGVVDNMDYMPFGELFSGGSSTTHKFTGKERDAETGLDNFKVRFSAATMARFMSPDPSGIGGANRANPQTLNQYTYGINNPLRFVDPTGMTAEDASAQELERADPTSHCDTPDAGCNGGELAKENADNQQADKAEEQKQTKDQQQDPTLNLGGTKVSVAFASGEFTNGTKGAVIDAIPEGGCSDCRWAQTVSRTGDGAMPEHTDRELGSGAQPLYPGGQLPGNDAANFHDEPKSAGPGTFTAVTTLGIANKAHKTFKVKGAMTWGYKIDKGGKVSGVAPRVATAAERARAIAVLRSESPGWTIR